MNVNLIAAVGKRGQLGFAGRIPWRDPEDMRWFRWMTGGDVVVMGRKTWTSLPTPTLEARTLVIVSANGSRSFTPDGANMPIPIDPERVMEIYFDRKIWVAGGEQIYRLWMPYVRRCYITRVDYDGPADVWMPPLWEAP